MFLVDFGQAFYGSVRLKVSGPAGTRSGYRTSFNVTPEGLLNVRQRPKSPTTSISTHSRAKGSRPGIRGSRPTRRAMPRSKVSRARPPRKTSRAW